MVSHLLRVSSLPIGAIHNLFLYSGAKETAKACEIMKNMHQHNNANYSLLNPFMAASQFNQNPSRSIQYADILASIRIGKSKPHNYYDLINVTSDFSHHEFIEEWQASLSLLAMKLLPLQYNGMINSSLSGTLFTLGEHISRLFKNHIIKQYRNDSILGHSNVFTQFKNITQLWNSMDNKARTFILKISIEKFYRSLGINLLPDDLVQMLVAIIFTGNKYPTNFITFVYFPPLLYYSTPLHSLTSTILKYIFKYKKSPKSISAIVLSEPIAEVFACKISLSKETKWFIRQYFKMPVYFHSKELKTPYKPFAINEDFSTHAESDESDNAPTQKATPMQNEAKISDYVENPIMQSDDALHKLIVTNDNTNFNLNKARMRVSSLVAYAYSLLHDNKYIIQPIIYGSVPSNTCLVESDIDIGLIGFPIDNQDLYLREYQDLEAKIRSIKNVIEVKAYLHASVPILKIKIQDFTNSVISADVILSESFSGLCPVIRGMYSMEMVVGMIGQHKHSRETILILKSLLKARKLNSTHEGGLSSYAVSLMVFSCMKNRQSQSVTSSVIDFLNIYGRLEYKKRGISDELVQFNKEYESSELVIIDPICKVNITTGCYMFHKIQEYFLELYELIMNACCHHKSIRVLLDIKYDVY